MSMPKFPDAPAFTICESLNSILASIAMEELAMSHILNAEGEKIQYVLGTLRNCQSRNYSIEEILSVNKSVNGTLNLIMQNQMLLKNKMESVLEAIEKCDCCKHHHDKGHDHCGTICIQKKEPCPEIKKEICPKAEEKSPIQSFYFAKESKVWQQNINDSNLKNSKKNKKIADFLSDN